MRVISIFSLKGGTAKTTTAVNLAYILAAVHNQRVLFIDNDKQGNGSKAFNRYDPEDNQNVAKIMLERNLDINTVIKKSDYENIDIITANMNLLEANMRVIVDTTRQQQTRFKKALASLEYVYDYCIIDNAPDINMSIINALVATDDVIVPMLVDQYSFDGYKILLEQTEQIREDFNNELSIPTCLVTQYQNNTINNQGMELLAREKMSFFTQSIRRTNKKVSESTFARKPVVEYSPRCGASQDYKKVVIEYLEKTAKTLDANPKLGEGKGGR